MTDIAQSLREFVQNGLKRMAFGGDTTGSDYDDGSILIYKAADEIERLRAIVAKLRSGYIEFSPGELISMGYSAGDTDEPV